MFKKIVPLLLLISLSSWADNVSQIFGGGIFETNWGQSLSELQKQFPNGDLQSVSGLKVLTIKDSRAVLGIERSKKHSISFDFNFEEKLKQITIQFSGSDYPEALNKLTGSLGDLSLETIQGGLAKGYTRWFNEDKSLSVAIFMAPKGLFGGDDTYVIVSKELELNKNVTKEHLGF